MLAVNWLLAVAGFVVAGLLFALLEHSRSAVRVIEAQLKGLGETHLLGFEALTNELRRLEKRLKELEEEVL